MNYFSFSNIKKGPVMTVAGVVIAILAVVGVIWFELEWEKAGLIIGFAAAALGLNEKNLKKKKP